MIFAAAMDATWPAASVQRVGPWLVREGKGGGNRVSAITAEEPGADDPEPAIRATRALGQAVVFRLGDEETALDAMLDRRGFRREKSTVLYEAPAAAIAGDGPGPVTAFAFWEPLQLMYDLWAETGIGPARIAVMERVARPKAGILGRADDRAAGVGFVAVDGDTAMVHALAVLPEFRRRKTARNMMREAARWAAERGATRIALAVEEENAGARALYEALGMTEAGRYHYRVGGDGT